MEPDRRTFPVAHQGNEGPTGHADPLVEAALEEVPQHRRSSSSLSAHGRRGSASQSAHQTGEDQATDGHALGRPRNVSEATASTSPYGSSAGTGSSARSSTQSKKRRLSVDVKDAGVFLSPASIAGTSKISCSECRLSKTKCSGGEICERCKRLGRQCEYKEHRRGRFSDSKRVQHLEKTVQSLLSQLRETQGGQQEVQVPVASASSNTVSKSRENSTSQLSTSNASVQSTSDSAPASPSFRRSLSPTEWKDSGNLQSILSQPLELLALVGDEADGRTPKDSKHADLSSVQRSRAGAQSVPGSQTHHAEGDEIGRSLHQTTALFLSGLCQINPDRADPIDLRIITLDKAKALYDTYLRLLDESVNLLDPYLHTFHYVRSHSSLLLTAICYVATLFDQESSQLSGALEDHIYQRILPDIFTDSLRSIEIVQALLLLVYYHPTTTTMFDNRSWQFVGHAARLGSELGLNRMVRLASHYQDDEGVVRRLRNRERTWLNLWMCEMMLCEHLGRLPLLRLDPLVTSSGGWHFHRFAIPCDSAIVCFIQMHLVLLRQGEMCERIILSSQSNTQTIIDSMMQLGQRNAIEQLDSWLATWTHGQDVSDSAGMRLRRARLAYWYTRTLIATRALHLNIAPRDALPSELYHDVLQSCLSYLDQFLNTFVHNRLVYSNNLTIVAPTYCSVVCLHVIARIPPTRDVFNIDRERLFALIGRLVDVMSHAASVTTHRRAAAGKYAPFLRTVLDNARRQSSGGWKGKENESMADPKQPHSALSTADPDQPHNPGPDPSYPGRPGAGFDELLFDQSATRPTPEQSAPRWHAQGSYKDSSQMQSGQIGGHVGHGESGLERMTDISPLDAAAPPHSGMLPFLLQLQDFVPHPAPSLSLQDLEAGLSSALAAGHGPSVHSPLSQVLSGQTTQQTQPEAVSGTGPMMQPNNLGGDGMNNIFFGSD